MRPFAKFWMKIGLLLFRESESFSQMSVVINRCTIGSASSCASQPPASIFYPIVVIRGSSFYRAEVVLAAHSRALAATPLKGNPLAQFSLISPSAVDHFNRAFKVFRPGIHQFAALFEGGPPAIGLLDLVAYLMRQSRFGGLALEISFVTTPVSE